LDAIAACALARSAAGAGTRLGADPRQPAARTVVLPLLKHLRGL